MEKRQGRSWTLLLFATQLMFAAHAMAEVTLPDEPQDEPSARSAYVETAGMDEAVNVMSPFEEAMVLQKYNYLDPKREVPDDLLTAAVTYFDAHQSSFANKSYISVIDFRARSTQARFFIIDMKSGAVWAIHVAHGKNSDPDFDGYATSFSNTSGSNKSSLGIYRTAETYNGSHGLSLRLDGLSSTNSGARARAIVIHGASYVQEKSVVQGRSWGCPAVAMGNRDEVVKRLKGGSMIYAGLAK